MKKIRGKVVGNPTITPMKIPDWNQNDERKADYIKNRTHYEGSVLVGEGVSGEGVVSVGYTYVSLSMPFDWNNAEIFVDGEKIEYEVHDNIESENLIIILVNGEYLLHYNNAVFKPLEIVIADTVPSGTHIQIYQSSVKTLDEKYIPNSIARVSDVEAMIGTVNDELESILNGGVD